MTSFPSHIAVIAHNVEKLFGYGSIVFDDIFALSKSAASKAISGSEVAGFVKPAVSKAAGVVVDDMTVVSSGVNESEISQDRENAIWCKIVAGSMINKIIVAAIILAAGVTFPILPEIMLGLGACYLAFEGAHKVLEAVNHFKEKSISSTERVEDLPQNEKTEGSSPSFCAQFVNIGWIKRLCSPLTAAFNRFLGTHPKERSVLQDLLILDGILSTEILLMANSTLTHVSLNIQIATLGVVGFVITLGVYGIVYVIIRADNFAESLCNPQNAVHCPRVASGILRSLPYALKAISVIGTVAMLGVAGEVAAHLLPKIFVGTGLISAGEALAKAFHGFDEALMHALPTGGKMLATSFTGFVAGTILIMAFSSSRKALCLVRGKGSKKF